MYISKIKIRNFRLLRDTILDLEESKRKELALLIGRNNSGKTSFITLFDKFYREIKFTYDDFSLCLRKNILGISDSTDVNTLAIQMILEIKYTKEDNLENLSDFILDLDPAITTVKILFECAINKKNLLNELSAIDKKEKFIAKNLSDYLDINIYVFDKDENMLTLNRHLLIKKEAKSVINLINFQAIHAKRDVASSESNTRDKKVLSALTTKYFNKENRVSPEAFNAINESILKMDSSLDENYKMYFDPFLKNSKDFLNITDIKVVSDLQSQEIMSNYSRIVYGEGDNYLPEHLNGLGYMNILYLLLQIEIKNNFFINEKKDINLLFIEEPEAHTHPQMQYIFANKIKSILESIENLQTIITTHSSHIVSQCFFEDIRYLKNESGNIDIKNFYKDLESKYKDEEDYFKFLKQYLTIQSSELFFARKIIFIEGTSERMLLPYFIKSIDEENKGDTSYIPLSSQNISVLEVGANARAFRHFLEFLGIKTLIITDIDTTAKVDKNESSSYEACATKKAENTSNYTLKYFLNAPEIGDATFLKWIENLKSNNLQNAETVIKLAYQIEDKGYHARSFEDAFININLDKIKEKIECLEGLRHKEEVGKISDIYELTKKILKPNGKSDFSSSVLFLALSKEEISWEIPRYIKEGLLWIAK
jgi:predicted ATP-dependent endonuclease of OLD family